MPGASERSALDHGGSPLSPSPLWGEGWGEGIIAARASGRWTPQQLEHARGGDGGTVDLDAVVGEGVLHRVGHRGGGGDDPALAHALDAEGVDRGGEVHVDDLERRHLVGARQRIVHEGAGEELARVVVDQRLAERAAEALGDAAVELALDDHRVDRPPAVVHGGQLEQPDAARLEVHLGDDALHAEGPRDRVGIEEGAGAEPGASRLGHRAAPHRGAGHLAQAHALAGHALHVHAALGEHDVLGRALEELGADEARLVRHLRGGALHRGAAHRGHAARDRAHAVADQAGVAAHDHHRLERHRQLVGRDLGQRGLVPLALGADAQVHEHGAVRIHADVRALEGADAGALDVGAEAEADGPRARRGASPARPASRGSRARRGAGRRRPGSRRGRR